VRIISTFTPAGIEGFFEETLERAQDAGRSRPDDLRAVRARYAEAAARYGLELFPEP
jgi:hypothetical protein